MSGNGPQEWLQPIFKAPQPAAFINGDDIGATIASLSRAMIEEQGVAVETADGQHVRHANLASASAPLSAIPWEFELNFLLVAEENFFRVLEIPSLARAGRLNIVLDAPFADHWIGNGSQTTFVLSHSTSRGTTGTLFTVRPDRCFLDHVELTVVDGAPAPGECQSPFTSDATTIVLGTPPADEAFLEFRYYAKMEIIEALYEDEMDGFNNIPASISFRSMIPVRNV